MSLTLAHLSDVHLAPLPSFGPYHLNLKRALGAANWVFKRRQVHLRPVLDAIVADVLAAKPDHIIVSGDLCNLGLPAEHEAALRWLEGLGGPRNVSVVPGNHDIYCKLWRDPGVARWKDYMSSIGDGYHGGSAELRFPYIRRLGAVAIVGVNSAIPTRPFSAIGRIGPRQLDALADALDRLRGKVGTRIVVIHHPPLPGMADWRHGLTDAAQLEQVLASHGADLVLHGHNHRDMQSTIRGPQGPIHVVGVGSASVGIPLAPKAGHEQPMARYNLIRFDPGQERGDIKIETRGLTSSGGPIATIGTSTLPGD